MKKINRQVLLSTPNLLTYGRIAVIPIILILMIAQGPQHTFEFNRVLSLIAAALFIMAGISDIVDGHYARKYGQVSLMGKFFDPMADKLIHMAVMVQMVAMDRLPGWLVVIHLFREIFITGLRSVAAGEGIIISADELGKNKTAWLNVALSALLIYYPIFGVSSYTVGWVCLVVATILSLVSGTQYVVHFVKQVNQNKS